MDNVLIFPSQKSRDYADGIEWTVNRIGDDRCQFYTGFTGCEESCSISDDELCECEHGVDEIQCKLADKHKAGMR